MVIGIDEAGRGALAGSVVAAAVMKLETAGDCPFLVTDSKRMSVRQREQAYDWLVQNVLWGVGIVSAQVIDEIGIKKANHQAMKQALNNCLDMFGEPVEALLSGGLEIKILVDGRDKYVFDYESEDIVGGDGKIWEIGAASILAKVSRDYYMEDLDGKCPGFGFAENKGYGAKRHLELIEQEKYTVEHRKSYDPLKTILTQTRLF